MKVLIITNNLILLNDGKLYTDGNTYGILKRFSYLGELKICAQKCPQKDLARMDTHLDFLSEKDLTYIEKSRMFVPIKTLNILRTEVIKADLIIGYQSPCVNAEAALKYAKQYDKKYMSYVVACAWDGFWNHGILGKLCAPYRYLRLRHTIMNSDYALYVTNDFLQSRYPNNGIKIGCSDVIIKTDNSVIQSRLSKISCRKWNDKINIITVGAINVKYKGQSYVIKALKKLKNEGINNVYYYLYGPGDKSTLSNIAKRLGVDDRVYFMGTVSHDEIPSVLDKMDIYIQPSLQEGLPRSVVEAMSRGLLCIGYKTAGIPELLETDYLVERKSVNGIVEQIKKVTPETLRNQAIRNFSEALKFQENKLTETRNKYMDAIIEDMHINKNKSRFNK